MSVAGGLPRAIARAHVHQCEALQIFTKNASQWRARPIPDDEIAAFKQAAKETHIGPIVSHASYLINVATKSPALRAQSLAALGEEVDRADAHPAEEVILNSHRPGVAVRVHGVAAHQAAVFGFDPCNAIHPERASDSAARWTRVNAKRNFLA